MKKPLSTVIFILIFLTGLSLLLYPSVSDYYNSLHQSRAIAAYSADVAGLNDEQYEALWQEAVRYNTELASTGNIWNLSDERLEEYRNTLNIDSSGIMSYIEIPKINCSLAIYHGTDDGVLQTGVGHIEGSSMPVGGEGTHCVLSGHRGLPSAKLFTDLDKLTLGDRFLIRTLDEILTYEVDQILIVLPYEVDALKIENGKDLCTLVTCTPYGVNSHRMLVRGIRVPYNGEEETGDTPQVVQYQALHTGTVVKRIVDAWPWISVTGSVIIGGEALLLLLLLHRCKKREEDD